MKTWAVGFISFHYNELKIEFIEAKTWQEAVPLHSKIGTGEGSHCWFLGDSRLKIGDELENWKEAFFDQDAMFDVREIDGKVKVDRIDRKEEI